MHSRNQLHPCRSGTHVLTTSSFTKRSTAINNNHIQQLMNTFTYNSPHEVQNSSHASVLAWRYYTFQRPQSYGWLREMPALVKELLYNPLHSHIVHPIQRSHKSSTSLALGCLSRCSQTRIEEGRNSPPHSQPCNTTLKTS
jgi:hypothetical protein